MADAAAATLLELPADVREAAEEVAIEVTVVLRLVGTVTLPVGLTMELLPGR